MGDLIDTEDEGDMKLDIGVPGVVWETKLRKLAGALTSLYGEELEVPYWVVEFWGLPP